MTHYPYVRAVRRASIADLDWQEDEAWPASAVFSLSVWRLAAGTSWRRRAAKGPCAVAAPTGSALKLLRKLHQTIAKITLDFEGRWHFNTCVAAIMELVNEMQAADAQLASGEVPPPVIRDLLRSLFLLLAPFAPFLAAELWSELGEDGAVLRASWPKSDPALAKEDEIEIPVQINGKLITVVRVSADASGKDLENTALADEKLQARIAGKSLVKIIVVPGKLVNLVIK